MPDLRPPVLHDLKAHPDAFRALWSGVKAFEYRKNDRDYRPGDDLWLREYDPETSTFSGRLIRASVPYIAFGGRFDVPEGPCVMSLANTVRFDLRRNHADV